MTTDTWPTVSGTDTVLRPARAADAAELARIYNHYIRETVITFEVTEISADEMANRIARIAAASLPWLVAEHRGAIVGYAYAGRWKERDAYRHSVESSVYLDPARAGQGFGTLLYRRLLDELQHRDIHAVIGGVALPNAASVRLHERLGFTKVAQFPQVGFKFGRWIDVGYWQWTRTTAPGDSDTL